MKKHFGRLYTPLAWTILIEILLCLPGPSLPNTGAFEIPYFDKIIHTVIFGVFVFLWCLYYRSKGFSNDTLKIIFFWIFIAALVNGIAIEYIQLYLIPYRSFDQGDIIADVVSAGVVYGICNVKLLTVK